MRQYLLFVFVAIFMIACGPSAFAEEKAALKMPDNLTWRKAGISFGAFASSTNSDIRLSAKGLGVGIDLEEVLGLDTSSTVFRLDGFWRFSDNLRHRADLSWFSLNREGETALGQSIVIDGITYPVGTYVETTLNMDIYKAAYSYSFLQDDRIDIAVGIGLYIMPIEFKLSASGLLTSTVAESITAPLPVFGLRADFSLTPKWILRTRADVFYLEYEQFKGSIYSTSLGIEYKAFKHVGFGLATDIFNLAVEAEGEDYPEINFFGKFEYRYLGAMLYAKYYF